jgi:hypothetical protein
VYSLGGKTITGKAKEIVAEREKLSGKRANAQCVGASRLRLAEVQVFGLDGRGSPAWRCLILPVAIGGERRPDLAAVRPIAFDPQWCERR